MKEKIVFFLCDKGLIKIANRISPSIVCKWRCKKTVQAICEGFESVNNYILTIAMGLGEFAKQIEEYKTHIE